MAVYIFVQFPATSAVAPLVVYGMSISFAAFLLLFILLLRLRVRLEEQRARVDALYLSLD